MENLPTLKPISFFKQPSTLNKLTGRLLGPMCLIAFASAVGVSASSVTFRNWLASLSPPTEHTLPVVTRNLAAVAPQAQSSGGLNTARRSHTATLLADGSVLVVGGENESGFVTVAEVFDLSSRTFSISGNLNTARADHTATRISNGRVLIAGGRGAVGALSSTEIFDPAAGTFTAGPSLTVARSGQTATTLSDGRIVLAGGDAAGSVEVYDPQANMFSAAGTMMIAPRTKHAAALLNDGRILIVGGIAADSSAVLSGEILDLDNSLFTAVDNQTEDAHVCPLLRVLPDGKVQIIGGTDHEDIEIYDPATNSFGAHAHIYPIGNSDAALLEEILDSPTRAALFHHGASNALMNRETQTITELPGSNRALVAGGFDATGNSLATASVLNSSATSVTTNKLDYAPGTPVIVSGASWQPSEVVTLRFHEDPHVDTENPHLFTVQADANGNFVCQEYAPEGLDAGVAYILAARGETSGWTAQTAFTDSSASDRFRTVASGDWNSITTWESSADGITWTAATLTPTSTANTITIRDGHTVSVTASPLSIDQVTVQPGGQVTVNSGITLTIANGPDPIDMDVAGIVRNAGTITATGTLVFESGGKYQHNFANAGAIPAATWNPNSTVEIVGALTGANPPGGLGQSFGHFTWNPASQTSAVNLAGALTTINGNFTIINTGTGQLRLTASASPTINVGGCLQLDAGLLIFTNGSGTPIVNVVGAVEINGGTLMPASNSGGTLAASTLNNLNVAGNWVNSGSFLVGSGNTVTFNGNNPLQTIAGASSTAFANIVVNKGASNANLLDAQSVITMNSGGLTLTNGTFKLSSASTITPFAAGDLTIGSTKGFWNNGGTVNGSAGSLIVSGLFKQSAGNTTIGTVTAHRLELKGNAVSFELSGGTLNLVGRYVEVNVGSGSAVNISGGTMNVATGGQLNEANSVFLVPSNSNFSASNGTIVIQNANQNKTQSDLKIDDPNMGITRSITGGSLQIGKGAGTAGDITINTGNVGLFNLNINAPSTTPTLASSLIINNILTLTSGNLVTGVSHVVAVGNSGDISRASGHIIGSLQKTFDTGSGQSFTFPVGDATRYAPATVSNLEVTTAGDLIVNTTPNDVILSTTGSGINAARDVNRSWQISKGGSGLMVSGYTVAFTYDAAEIDAGANESAFILRKLSSGVWSSPPGGTSANAATHTITGIGFTDTSDFAAGEPVGTVQFSAANYNDAETDSATHTATISVQRKDGSSGAVDVSYATSEGTATLADNDYSSAAGTLHWDDGDSADKTFAITVTGDTTYEADETVNLVLLDVTGGAAIGGTNPATLTIQNDDSQPTISVSDQSQAEGDVGTSNFEFNVTLSNASYQTITVHYATSDGTATAPDDYTPATDTLLTFNPGDTVKTVAISVNGDTTYESNETLSVNLSTATNATIADSPGVGTITNDDPAPSFSIDDVTHNEGDAGTANYTFTVTLAGTTALTSSVDFSTEDGSATLANNDYVASSGTLNFAPGDTSNQITVTVNGDTAVEPDETFSVRLANPTNAAILNAVGTGAISNDDTSVSVAVLPATVAEDSGTHLTYTFTRIGVTTGSLMFNFSVGGTATFTTDYTQTGAATFTSSSGTAIFAAGNSTTTVTIYPTADTLYEPDETVILSAAPGTGYNIGAPSEAIGTITDDDAAPTISISDVSLDEGDSGTTTFSFAVSLSNASSTNITVDFATEDGTSTQPSDYTVKSGTVTFLPGETSKQIAIEVNGDVTYETNESFFVNLNNNSANSTLGNSQGVGTIFNDDSVPALAIGDVTQPEGNSGTNNFDFAVMLSHPSYQTITVHYSTTDGTASQPGDYNMTSGTVTFDPGDTSKTVSVSVNGDTAFEADETFSVNLDTPTDSTIVDGAGTGTIQNDDNQPTVQFSAASSAGAESVSPVTLEVTLSNSSYQTVTVDYAANGASSTSTGGGVDYTLAPGTLTFNPGDTSRSVTLLVNNDNLHENDELVIVDLSSPTNATAGSPATHAYTIQDNDAPPSFAVNDVTMVEGNLGSSDFIFTVTKTGPTALTATVNYATSNGMTNPAAGGVFCEAGIDYETKAGVLSFSPGDLTLTLTIKVCGDALSEANETFLINLSDASNATISDNQGVGTIQNDDASAYKFEGFFAPIDNLPIVNTVKAGSAVPVKWRIVTSGGAPVSDPNSFAGLFSNEVNCGSTTGLEAPIETVAPGGSVLQYLGNGNWQINWKTLANYPKASCRLMELRLNDGTSRYANFKFK